MTPQFTPEQLNRLRQESAILAQQQAATTTTTTTNTTRLSFAQQQQLQQQQLQQQQLQLQQQQQQQSHHNNHHQAHSTPRGSSVVVSAPQTSSHLRGSEGPVGSSVVVEKFNDDELSIVASDEEGSSADGVGMSQAADDKGLKTAPIDLVRNETRAVSYLRYLIMVLLIAASVLMCIGTWRVAQDAESGRVFDGLDDAVQEEILSGSCSWNVQRIEETFVATLRANLIRAHELRLNLAYTFAISFTSFVVGSDALSQSPAPPVIPLPNVTIPHFDPRMLGILRHGTGVTEVHFAPLVQAAMRAGWEEYAVDQQELYESGNFLREKIFNYDETPIPPSDVTSPVWQIAPTGSTTSSKMQNQLGDQHLAEAVMTMEKLGAAVWTDIVPNNDVDQPNEAPYSTLFFPLYGALNQLEVVGSLAMYVNWTAIVETAIPVALTLHEDKSIVLQSCSNQTLEYTYAKDGTLTYSGYSETLSSKPFQNRDTVIDIVAVYPHSNFIDDSEASNEHDGGCEYKVWVLSASAFAEMKDTGDYVPLDSSSQGSGSGSSSGIVGDDNLHVVLTSLVATMFFVISVVFLIFDFFVEKRQSVVVNIATKSSAIVENLFPAQVRDRMLQNMQQQSENKPVNGAENVMMNGDIVGTPNGEQIAKSSVLPTTAALPNQVSVKQFLTNQPEGLGDLSSQPIADLFPNTTVLFADIAGFTAWSSQREPPQVFTLLETLYRSFDVIAGKLKVFKVETIGDCYMAVTGLPNPDESHAVHMSRFAYQCLIGMKELIWELEAILGPGTSDLALRVGLHSGPVTAGVLRGEKSRFQLFGDTVNTASRMESTGQRGKIQVSQETADLLMAAGKSHWLKPRDELVLAKGKGELKTYWLDPTKKRRNTKNHKDIRVAQEISLNNREYMDKPMSPADVPFDEKYARLIDWNVDVLLHHLARVISCRSRSPSRGSLVNHSSEVALLPAAINDVAEVVALPPFDPDSSRFRRARPDVSMLQQTRADLHEYVKRIALMYHDVPFHNFEHASHVTLCANKLLNRLINSDEYDTEEELHNATFGISSDPLTHFAIVFAALIHDVDHTGLPNAQLVKDHHELADKFENKSVAEQNSVHIGWELLMDPRFERLRKCIYQTNVERKRFRQLVINSVMATDIADRQVNEERQMKWDRAFRRKTSDDATALQIQEDMNRKATAVIEHIIQVSDVAHTMQHWHIYRRWNERLFHEMHEAYQSGRVSVDPSTNWYIGELGFFDYYLIPLAMKLKECGVFGASGYEYISYVLKNKKEWERKGRQVVQEMVLLYKDVDEDEEHSESSLEDSLSDYDSDDLDYDSPGDLSTESEEELDIDSMDHGQHDHHL